MMTICRRRQNIIRTILHRQTQFPQVYVKVHCVCEIYQLPTLFPCCIDHLVIHQLMSNYIFWTFTWQTAAHTCRDITSMPQMMIMTMMTLIIRPQWQLVMTTYYYKWSSMVDLSVRVSVGHICEPCKNGWTDQNSIWGANSGEPKEPCIRWRCRSPKGKRQFLGEKRWPL